MSHEITRDDQLVSRTTPWHGLGIVTDRQLTTAEALELSGLGGWNVEKVPLEIDFEGTRIVVPNHYATVRTDTGKVLGVVGEDYQPLQNEALFEFADRLLDSGDAMVETAGSLRSNRVVFVTVEVKRPVQIADVDFKPYLVLAHSHDGTLATKALVTPTVVVCANTLRLAQRDARYEYAVKHTYGQIRRLDDARQALGITFEYLDGFEAEIARLVDTDFTDRQFNELVTQLVPDSETVRGQTNAKNRREELHKVWVSDPAAAPWRGTAWGALNAVNTWETWMKPVRKSRNVTGDDRHQVRLEQLAWQNLQTAEMPLTAKARKTIHEMVGV